MNDQNNDNKNPRSHQAHEGALSQENNAQQNGVGQWKNIEVSLFKSVYCQEPKTMKVGDVLLNISIGYWHEHIQKLREIESEERQGEYKKKIPCVTTSCICEGGHHESNIVRRTNLICMDFDGHDNPGITETLDDFKTKFIDDPFICGSFISCRGQGLACIIQYDGEHREAWQQIACYFKKKYNLIADESGKDITRLRIVSHDPDPVFNESPKVFQTHQGNEAQAINVEKNEAPKTEPRQDFRLCKSIELLVKNGVRQGERDSTCHFLANEFQRRRLSKEDAVKRICEYASKCQPPFPEDEAIKKIERIYSKPLTETSSQNKSDVKAE